MSKAKARREARKLAASFLKATALTNLHEYYEGAEYRQMDEALKRLIWIIEHPGTSYDIHKFR